MLKTSSLLGAAVALSLSTSALADHCATLASEGLDYATLTSVLSSVVNVPGSAAPNGGLGFPMWLTLVDDSGVVCSVTTSLKAGQSATTDIWLGSRVISAQKANTANSFSIPALSLSSANLYAPTQPGGSLFGLQESNPVDATVAYRGEHTLYGTAADPLVGNRIGGINVFGGGLTLYSTGPKASKIGAIGVSGDTSCTDHVVAYKVREALAALKKTPVGNVIPGAFDKMLQDIKVDPVTGLGVSASGFGHPLCLNNPTTANDGGSIVHDVTP